MTDRMPKTPPPQKKGENNKEKGEGVKKALGRLHLDTSTAWCGRISVLRRTNFIVAAAMASQLCARVGGEGKGEKEV